MKIPSRGSAIFTKEPTKRRNGTPRENNQPLDEKIQEEIRTTAYYRFLARGGNSGNELADWFQAEREVRRRHQLV